MHDEDNYIYVGTKKIIDLMTNKLALYCEINCEEDIKTNKEQIRQYFENKAKEK